MTRRAAALAAPAALLALAALRFHEYVLGGSVWFRDASFFFVPWRLLTARLLSDGSLPVWNPWASGGRALAADPNAAVFWPPTLLTPFLGPTGLFLLHVALTLLLFVVALRWLSLSPAAAGVGGAVLLFSGVFQTVPLLFTTVASAAPIPLALVALAGLEPGDGRDARRRVAAAGLALGLSFLGGEPFITASGAVAAVALGLAGAVSDRRSGRPAGPRLLALAGAGTLALLVAAVQLVPALGELARSERATAMRAEEGALFWSVRPARLLTLLEPRLTGDPFAEEAPAFWGAGTFDAGNPYFYDVALGVLPLGLAAVAVRDRRGRGALGLAFLGALLSFGRHVPGLDLPGRLLPFFRYPEKWWLLVTLSLAAAAAVGWDRLEREPGAAAHLQRVLAALASALGVLLGLAVLSPRLLRSLLWGLGLGAGETPPGTVSSVLVPALSSGLGVALGGAVVGRALAAGRLPAGLAGGLLATLFLLDAGRRVAGTCPAGPPDAYERATPEVALVLAETGRGRFHDDGADDPRRAVARALARDGRDLLRPLTGAAFGVPYAGENDVDRLTPRETTAWTRQLAHLPWGERKVRLLETAGVSVVRTASPGPDPAGVTELARLGGDRLLRLAEPRPLHLLVRSARFVPAGQSGRRETAPAAPLRESVVEDAPGAGRTAEYGEGRLELLEARPARDRLRVDVTQGGGLLVVARTFDPHWKATVDGSPVRMLRADGPFAALPLPAGRHEVVLAYRNPLLGGGACATLAGLSALALLVSPRRRPR